MPTIKSFLVFPPGWTPFGPYLALPALKGYLEERGIVTEISDQNVAFFDYLLAPKFLSKAYQIAESRLEQLETMNPLPEELRGEYRKIGRALLSKYVLNQIESAKSKIRSREFYDQKIAKSAKQVLCDALDLASCAYENFKLAFNDISLKHNPTSTRQILEALEDEKGNPYIDFYFEELIPLLNERKIDLLGISVTSSSQLIPAITLAHLARKHCPSIKHITLGGNLITRLATHWEEPHPFFNIVDSIITYEGEEALFYLIKALDNCLESPDLSKVPNLVYVQREVFCKNEVGNLETKDLTLPNFDGYITDKYFMPDLVLPLYSSKSCFAKCTFCTIPFATHGSYRVLSIDQIFSFMTSLSEKYKTPYFTFVDETFAPPIMQKLATKVINEKANFKWYGETRFMGLFTEDFCRTLYEGGCRKIQFGLESYDQRVLDMMRKNVKVDWIQPAIENCFKAGIAVHLFFMVGFPTETKEEALKTIRFTRQMMELSHHIYELPYSSRGWSAFGLDKYSGVWLAPDYYGISIKYPAREYDLALHNIEYDTTKGMSSLDAEILVSQYRETYQMLSVTPHHSFHELVSQFHAEEEPFLRLCQGDKYLKASNKISVRIKSFKNSFKRRVCFIPTVVDASFNHNLLTRSLKSESVIILYNYLDQTVYALPKTFEWILKSLYQGGVALGDLVLDSTSQKIISDLIAFRLIQFVDEGVGYPNDQDWQDNPLYFSKEAVQIPTNNDRFLYLYSTGKMMRLNAKTHRFLSEIFDGSKSFNQILKDLKNRSGLIDLEKVKTLTAVCLKNGFLEVCHNDFVMEKVA